MMFVAWTHSDKSFVAVLFVCQSSLDSGKCFMLGCRWTVSASHCFVLFFYTMLLKQQQCSIVFKNVFHQPRLKAAQHTPNNQVPKFSAAYNVFSTLIWPIKAGACVSLSMISMACSHHGRSVVQMASLSESMLLLLLIITWSGFIL